ncbi:RDD family protein [Roseateles depolymerans]|uniref:Membrane protein containing RDD domain protein n=1 Tax=Roseateles depolymerans TaxID=76731 RepID=A0A0U3MKE2_9BURK|nr:RDD family protein [Roseateles depolymerans]ALV08937.1 Membrane protein containing RDD domain protein [Roseateles depolymerans]REG09401.1 putative RDD family membrane protein YckC [Roseateles depolymerans]
MTVEHNPYLPPVSTVADRASDETSALASEAAGKGRRFATFVVDYIFFLVLSFMVGIGAALVFGDRGVEFLQKTPDIVLGSSIFFVYYVFFEGIWARSPGKFICGTRVINEAGGKPSWGQVLGRSACRFIPFEALSCFAQRPWHDSIPKTRVVLTRKS